MEQLHNTTKLSLPLNLPVSVLMNNLEIGHGYKWIRLLSSPKPWIYGKPPSRELPEVLIIGKDILLETDSENIHRFQRLLQALSHESILLGGR